jgi:Ca-activated chloride channel family protein
MSRPRVLIVSLVLLATACRTAARPATPADSVAVTPSAPDLLTRESPPAPEQDVSGKGVAGGRAMPAMRARLLAAPPAPMAAHAPPVHREQYARITDNPFVAVAAEPRATFSTDVDRASYGNVRRFLLQGQRPTADAVRIEELLNYFPYDLAAPRGDAPLAVTTEVIPAPWEPRHRLLRVALQARRIAVDALPPANLVFLVDVSGSMMDANKLPLVQQALRLLVEQLRPQDRVALVTYASGTAVRLESTPGSAKARRQQPRHPGHRRRLQPGPQQRRRNGAAGGAAPSGGHLPHRAGRGHRQLPGRQDEGHGQGGERQLRLRG